MTVISCKIISMKAERLISILLLLQTKKGINTRDLAEQLGVSIRTIFRDLQELNANGFPLYSEHGPGGGVYLVEGYNAGIKTLTKDEAAALQWLRFPATLSPTGSGRVLQHAVLKILSALPEQNRQQHLLVDWSWWEGSDALARNKLEQVYEAISQSQTIRVVFPLWNHMDFSQEIDPYGIVAKAGEWYLVYACSGRYRMRKISDFLEISKTGAFFKKPVEFDLPSVWNELCKKEQKGEPTYSVQLKISDELFALMDQPSWGAPYIVRTLDATCDADGYHHCTLDFENLIEARTYLLGWGNAILVISPLALKTSLVDFARQVIRKHEG
jgi:predicted DNA-binding transcriptional regulator YafY